MNILAIDTATEACSAALLVGDDLIERFELAPRQHTAKLLPMMESVLAEAETTLSQLDALAFSRGPGSFTGVRVAASVIQGVGLATDLPIIPVSTLAAMAHHVFRQGQASTVGVAIDARMQQVYWGQYRISALGQVSALADEQVIDPDQVALNAASVELLIGNGWAVYADQWHPHNHVISNEFNYPHASDVCWIAKAGMAAQQGVTVEQALPVYLRDQVVRT